MPLRGHHIFQRGLNQINARGAGGAIRHGDAVKEKRGGEGAEDEIFQAGFVGFDGAAAKAGEDVAGDGAHLQADERGDQFVCAGEDAHAGSGEKHQRIIFAALDAFFIQIIDGAEDRQRRRDDHHDVHKHAESVGADQVAIGRALVVRHHADAAQRGQRADKCDPSQSALSSGAEEGIHDHDEDAEEAQDDFRREAMQIRDLLGRELHYRATRLSEMVASDASRSRGETITVRLRRGGWRQRGLGSVLRTASELMHQIIGRGFHAPREERGRHA